MSFFKRHKILFFAAGVFVLCFLVFVMFWHLDVAAAKSKSVSVKLNDSFDTPTVSATDGTVIEQTFFYDEPFHGIGLTSANEGFPPGTLYISVYDDFGNLLAEATGRAEHTRALEYFVFSFPDTISSENGVYHMSFHAEMENPADTFMLYKSSTSPENWQLTEGDSTSSNQALSLLLATDSIGDFLTVFYWVFAVCVSASLSILFWLAFHKKPPLYKLFAVAISILGILYCFILPPYSSPDEQFHINQAFNMSSKLLNEAPDDIPWGTNYKRASDTGVYIEDKDTTVFAYRELIDGLFTTASDPTPTAFEGEEVGGYTMLYYPSAIAVTIARLLGLGFSATLILGRLANFALSVFLFTMSVKLVPFGKNIFVAVGLLPMSLHLLTSFSRDALTIALYAFFTALCLYYTFEKPRLDVKDLILLAVLCMLAAPSKGTYMPILALILFIPREKIYYKDKVMHRNFATVLLLSFLALGVFAFLLQNGYAVILQESGLGAVLLPVVLAGGAFLTHGAKLGTVTLFSTTFASAAVASDSITFSIMDILTSPVSMLWMLARTFFENITFYFSSMLGSHLSYFTLELNEGFTIVLTILLIAAALPAPSEHRLYQKLTLKHTLFSAVFVLATCALVVVGSILWTPRHYDVIYGIQGRYFLPALPLALFVLQPIFGRVVNVVKTKSISHALVFCFSSVSAFALLNALLLILER